MKYSLLKSITGMFLVVLMAFALTASVTTAPKKLDLILLIGQSNMAGRGQVDSKTQPEDTRIWAINAQNEWVVAKDPVHFDKPKSVGVGPGLAFAQEVIRLNPAKVVGLIPCAVGGSGIDDWVPGSKHSQTGIFPYDAMLERVRAAQQNGRIKAILWHQGESDSNPEKSQV